MDFQTNAVTTGDADFTLGRLYHSRANRNGYKNPELDKILDEAAAASDQNKRKELYAQANKIIWDEAVGIFPFDLLAHFAYRKTVEGFVPTPSAFLSFYNTMSKRLSRCSTYVARRSVFSVFVLWGALTVVFLAVRAVPGDPAQMMLGPTPRPPRSRRCARSSG